MKSFFTLELAVEFYKLSKNLKLPHHLKSQYLRDRKKFYFIALGSLRECQTILRLHEGELDLYLQKADFLGICLYRLCQAVK